MSQTRPQYQWLEDWFHGVGANIRAHLVALWRATRPVLWLLLSLGLGLLAGQCDVTGRGLVSAAGALRRLKEAVRRRAVVD